MPIRESITLDEVLAFFNELLALDRQAISTLMETRVRCNKALADHPTVQVVVDSPYAVGLLGILNGLFGVDERQFGAIAAYYDVVCPDGDLVVDGLRVNDFCPICSRSLVLGPLVKFERI